MGVLVPRLPERHSPLLVDSYTHELKQQHKMPNKGSKKAKKSGSNIFSLFSQKQIQEFKEAFGIIDNDKDGIITAPDLKKAFEGIGRPISDGEANNMVGEAPGGTDDDDVIVRSFEAFEINGQIDAEMFRHSLMTWGEKFVERDRRRFPRVQDRRGDDRRRAPQEHHGGQEGRGGIKSPFESRHQHLPTTNCWGGAKKAPKNLCIKNVSESEQKKQHQGHLNMRIDQEKISQCCNRK